MINRPAQKNDPNPFAESQTRNWRCFPAAVIMVLILMVEFAARTYADEEVVRPQVSELERDILATVELLEGVLEGTSPKQGGGRNLAELCEILDQHLNRMEGALAGDPELEAALRVRIGDVYLNPNP